MGITNHHLNTNYENFLIHNLPKKSKNHVVLRFFRKNLKYKLRRFCAFNSILKKLTNYVKKPIINCHTHIFTGDNIPPHIGKTFMPGILYRFLTVPLVIGLCKFWFTSKYSPYKFKFSYQNSRLRKTMIKIKLFWQKIWPIRTLIDMIGFFLVIFSSYLLFMFFLSTF